jgi:hypothetical protein
MPKATIKDVPLDVLGESFKFLDNKSVLHLSSASKLTRAAVKHGWVPPRLVIAYAAAVIFQLLHLTANGMVLTLRTLAHKYPYARAGAFSLGALFRKHHSLGAAAREAAVDWVNNSPAFYKSLVAALGRARADELTALIPLPPGRRARAVPPARPAWSVGLFWPWPSKWTLEDYDAGIPAALLMQDAFPDERGRRLSLGGLAALHGDQLVVAGPGRMRTVRALDSQLAPNIAPAALICALHKRKGFRDAMTAAAGGDPAAVAALMEPEPPAVAPKSGCVPAPGWWVRFYPRMSAYCGRSK